MEDAFRAWIVGVLQAVYRALDGYQDKHSRDNGHENRWQSSAVVGAKTDISSAIERLRAEWGV